jgi:hypothetical protein
VNNLKGENKLPSAVALSLPTTLGDRPAPMPVDQSGRFSAIHGGWQTFRFFGIGESISMKPECDSLKNDKMHEFVAVVDLGDKVDYRSEIRFRLGISLSFRLTGRSGMRQLGEAYQQVVNSFSHGLPTSHRRLHVWLFDVETGQPSLFVSGLLAVREGRLTKQQAERRDRKIRPQVSYQRPTQQYRFLLHTTAHGWANPEEFDCEEDAPMEEREYAVLDGLFGGFDHYELIDVDHVDDDYVGVTAEIRHGFTLELPFTPGEDSTETLLAYVVGEAQQLIQQEVCDELYDIRTEEVDVWLLDESGRPAVWVSGLMRVKEGSLKKAAMKKQSRQLLEWLPDAESSKAA